MKLCSFKELASLCNQDIESDYQQLLSILKKSGLEAQQVMDLLIDYSKGEDLAEDTINNLSKRLIYICGMDQTKTLMQEVADGWITFGTIHSDKQRYDLKKIEGLWYAKIQFNRLGDAEQMMAIELTADAQQALNQRLA